MGRIDTSATQYHQGLEFEEFPHQTQTQETIDDSPPEDQDLYDKIGSSQLPTDDHKPQAFPLTHAHQVEEHDDHEKPQAFPPPHDETSHQAFPPDHHEEPHAFPPTQAESFPPPPSSFPPQHENVNEHYFPQQQQSFPHQSSTPGVQIPQVINTSPFVQVQNQLPTQLWHTSLFDCMRDPQNAIITAFFPCVTFGQIAEILDSGTTSCGTSGMLYGVITCCILMPCIMSCSYRSKLRSRFGLVEAPAPDCIIHCFCEWCALCQEYRELQARGIDPTIGWLGNVARQQKNQQFAMTAAPVQQRMM